MSDSLTALEAESVRLHPSDNVVVAPARIPKGARLARENVTAIDSIPMGHKIAARRIAAGEIVRKYGQVIGVASTDIPAGTHVHVHNLALSDQREQVQHDARWSRTEPARTFDGYRRKDGRAGVRNYVGILTSVNCSATVARHIAEAAEKSGLLDGLENVDGIVPITHTSGCGMAGSGEGFDILRRTLWGTAANANFGAILLVGLGCEVLQVDRLSETYGLTDGRDFHSFTIQDSGGTKRAIAEGLDHLKAILPELNKARRT
ncbi:MAG TPA: UxaA family hydrolase, partial [Rhizomicrobium sp.]|nr:UxaA family hydrolase [Rhizomicrobium sp.]